MSTGAFQPSPPPSPPSRPGVRLEWSIVAETDAPGMHRILWVLPDWIAATSSVPEACLRPRHTMTFDSIKAMAAKHDGAVPGPEAYVAAYFGAEAAEGKTQAGAAFFPHLLAWEELLGCNLQIVKDASVLRDPAFYRGAQHPTLYLLTEPPTADAAEGLFDAAFYEYPVKPTVVPLAPEKVNIGPCSMEDRLIAELVLTKKNVCAPCRALRSPLCDLLIVLGDVPDGARKRVVAALEDIICAGSVAFAAVSDGWPDFSNFMEKAPDVMALPAALTKDDVERVWDMLAQYPAAFNTVVCLGALALDGEAREAWQSFEKEAKMECVYDVAAWQSLTAPGSVPGSGRICLDAPTVLAAYASVAT